MADEPVEERDLITLIDPTEKQRVFARAADKYEFVLYGGAAGGGKSYIIRWLALYYLVRWFVEFGVEGAVFGVFCETFPDVTSRQLVKAKEEFPDWLGRWVSNEFILHDEYGHGRVSFRNLDRPQKYRSVEFAGIAVDELTMNSLETIEELWQRKRWPGIEHSPFFAGTNPGGPGHAWVKRVFIEKNLPDYMRRSADNPQGYDGNDFHYVKALPTDNPHNPKNYIRTLGNLPPNVRKAMLEGDWDAFAGMFFTSYTRHAMDEEPFEVDFNWKLLGGYDPGWKSPASFGLYAVEPSVLDRDTKALRRGKIHKIFNYYVAGRNDQEHAKAIRELLDTCQWTKGRQPDYVIAGKDAFHRKHRFASVDAAQSELTTADIFEQEGIILEPAVVSGSSRHQTLAVLNMCLDQGRLKTFRGECEPLHEELAGCLGDDRDPEDIKGRGNDPGVADHAIDETRNVVFVIEDEILQEADEMIDKALDYGLMEEQEWAEELRDEQESRRGAHLRHAQRITTI